MAVRGCRAAPCPAAVEADARARAGAGGGVLAAVEGAGVGVQVNGDESYRSGVAKKAFCFVYRAGW